MSLRLRLTLAYVGLFALALTALDIGLFFVVNRALINGIDNELNLGAQVFVQSFNDAADEPSLRSDLSDLPAFLAQGNGLDSVRQRWQSNRVFAQSPWSVGVLATSDTQS